MEKRAAITQGILFVTLLFGVAFATLWLIRRSPASPVQISLTGANSYAGLDCGYDAIGLAKSLNNTQVSGFRFQVSPEGWMRLRGIDLTMVAETREALLTLRAKGIKTCVFLRRSIKDWKVSYLPADLSEAYEHGRKLGATFGDLVDAWEVDNEPDLGFVPESAERYTAFLKATYLGLQRGFAEAKEQSGKSKVQSAQPLAPRPSLSAGARNVQVSDDGRQTSDVSQQESGSLNNPQVSGFRSQVSERAPLVIMGSLGLPPGPWLERFAANDGFAYTDGFNYHYYGYADDFTGVYRQFEEAVKQLSVESYQLSGGTTNNSQPTTNNLSQKNLPIFLTEIGYGMLGKQARDTKEGRLRQWRWFKSVGEQIATLQPEAPMAFYLRPYLEYDTSEYGLTVPAKPDTGKPETGNLKPEIFTAGGIEYRAGDFGAEKSEPWMRNIGKEIGGNQVSPALAQWLAARNPSGFRFQVSGFSAGGSRSWSVTTAPPSPIVLDFLPGEGLSHVKRYNGLFVTGVTEVRRQTTDDGKDAKPPSAVRPQSSEQPRGEELILQVRTQNGNLFEVYPTRQATPEWQRFLEPGDNFTMAFYGRAALPWRFKDNKPASLVVVMYPKQLPATYEFRRPQLLKLGAGSPEHGTRPNNQEPITSYRYGAGTVVLYNFSDKPVTGRLILPEAVGRVVPNAPGIDESVVLQPHERREIPVSIKVPWDRYERIPVEISFVPIADNLQVSLSAIGPAAAEGFRFQVSDRPVSRFRTDLIPDIGGMPATLVADLLAQRSEDRRPTTDGGQQPNNQEPSTNNRDLVATRPRASEEAPMTAQGAFFAQEGAQLSAFSSQLSDTFSITVTSIPAGRHQRIEIEIPWPDGLAFGEDEFLSMEFRIR